MVYFQPQYFDAQFLDPNRARPVEILYNGSGIHKITGPVPLVDISKSANRNSAGAIESYTTRIDIDGKIVRTGIDGDLLLEGSGIGPVLSGINELKDFFDKAGDFGILEIKCGVTDTIFSATGVKVTDISFNRSDDNWIFTADYNISMEYYEPSISNNGHYVQNTNDSWTVEPVEEYTYSYFLENIKQKQETHNPELLPQAPTEQNPVPSQYNIGSSNVGSNNLSFINIPQYRITHRVSAVGLPSGTGIAAANSAYFNAKSWVEERLSTSFDFRSGYGLAKFNYDSDELNKGHIALYNHLRNSNFSISDGSYEVNDTWIAMPTGIPYIEDYTIEASTDDKFLKTIRIQGQIKGLSISNLSMMSGEPTYHIVDNSGFINLSGSLISNDSPNTSYKVPDNNINNNQYLSKNVKVQDNKYHNAMSGWLYDIKPYLYRRASLAVNSPDRDRDYIDSRGAFKLPGNPIFSYEPLLNPRPISTTEGLDPRKGTISYSVEYNNKLNIISGVISENINISDTGPTDVFGETFIIGRRLGPILQSLNAKNSTKKDVTIEVTVVPPSSINGVVINNKECPVYTGGSIYSQIEQLIEGLRPFGARSSIFGSLTRDPLFGQVYLSQDNQNWSPAEGRYSRSVSWVYQQCSNNRNYLNH